MSITANEINNSSEDFPALIREEVVQTAVKFLQNKNVVNTPLAQKQKFLQRKGLSDQEIQVSCERSGAYVLHESQKREPPPLPYKGVVPVSSYTLQGQLQSRSVFEKFREIVHNVAVVSAVVYAVYMFYKKFIRPFLFGGKKKKTLEDSVEDLSKSVKSSVDELRENLTSVKVEVDKISQGGEYNITQRQLQDLKSEISSVKGLLLSRKQFPSVSNSPVVPPSIPAWQLSSQHDPDPDPTDHTDAKSEDLMEIGSGSGSSEPEQATKNSDSSLEIM